MLIILYYFLVEIWMTIFREFIRGVFGIDRGVEERNYLGLPLFIKGLKR